MGDLILDKACHNFSKILEDEMIRKLLTVLLLLISIGPVNFVSAMPASPLTDAPPSLGFTEIINGLSSPVSITHAGDSSGRLFVTLLDGQIMIYDGSQVAPTPFLDLSSLVVSGGEQGLLSVAFHPNYESNGLFYVYYTRIADGALVVARYHVSADPNIADAGSASILLIVPHAEATNHNGGQLQFGPDGYLYIGTGDGGTGGAHAQEGTSLLGKILRIDVNGAAPYTIPADNPFVSDATVADEIWALGLRNPWRFSFDSLTGDLMLADVGQNSWEEVNVQSAGSAGGQNYGWPCYEGLHTYGDPAGCIKGVLTSPVAEYEHGASDSNGCSISGGYRYRGSEYPNLSGIYLYGDFCTGRIWGAEQVGGAWVTAELADTDYGITTFGEGEDGSLYVADYFSGTIYKILASTFSDVPSSYWAWDYIERLYKSGITGGCSTSPLMYCPEAPVTRAQMAIFILRGEHGSSYIPPIATGAVFGDVPSGAFASDWIEQLAAEGVTAGCGNGNYCPDANITRSQMAIFLLRGEHGSAYVPPMATGTVFGDVPPGSFASDWIEQLAAESITGGCGGGNYCPDANVTRDQMAVFLVKTFGLP